MEYTNAEQRNEDILKRFLAGEFRSAIARDYNLTRERIRQIVNTFPAGVAETKRRTMFCSNGHEKAQHGKFVHGRYHSCATCFREGLRCSRKR